MNKFSDAYLDTDLSTLVGKSYEVIKEFKPKFSPVNVVSLGSHVTLEEYSGAEGTVYVFVTPAGDYLFDALSEVAQDIVEEKFWTDVEGIHGETR